MLVGDILEKLLSSNRENNITTVVNFIQIFSSLVTIITGIGWGIGVPESLQKIGINVTHLQIAFFLSLVIAIGMTVQKRKNKKDPNSVVKKSQFQFGGRGNRQDMK